jgi:CheY-like chemotaxis protein
MPRFHASLKNFGCHSPMARVLLAEADHRIGDFIAGILAEFGHEVTMCTDAVEAGVHLAAEPIDVLLTDFMLSDGENAAVGQAWQALDIPMITLTGLVFSTDRSAPPPPPLIDKPFRFADLQSVLDAVAGCTTGIPPRRAALANAA